MKTKLKIKTKTKNERKNKNENENQNQFLFLFSFCFSFSFSFLLPFLFLFLCSFLFLFLLSKSICVFNVCYVFIFDVICVFALTPRGQVPLAVYLLIRLEVLQHFCLLHVIQRCYRRLNLSDLAQKCYSSLLIGLEVPQHLEI